MWYPRLQTRTQTYGGGTVNIPASSAAPIMGGMQINPLGAGGRAAVGISNQGGPGRIVKVRIFCQDFGTGPIREVVSEIPIGPNTTGMIPIPFPVPEAVQVVFCHTDASGAVNVNGNVYVQES
jgi:hypothetical protein